MAPEILGKIADHTGRGLEVLIEIRDCLKQTPSSKSADAPRLGSAEAPAGKLLLTTKEVLERLAHLGPQMTQKNLMWWLNQHPELSALVERRGRGKTLLWDEKAIYWFADHRDEKGRYRD